MVQSMTAFARREKSLAEGEFVWEIRGVNHRYFELSIRLPDALRAFESRLRQQIAGKARRGKLDATLRFQPAANAESFEIDMKLAQRIVTSLTDIAQHMGGIHTTAPNPMDILRWPGVLMQQAGPDPQTLADTAAGLLAGCLDDLVEARGREGNKLAGLISDRLDELAIKVDEVETRVPVVLGALRERLRERLAELLERVDPERVEQEIVLSAQKMDVAEEVDRLRIHVAEIRDTLTLDEAIGRRLDFLIQELNRETNTIASKSNDAIIAQAAVDMKVLIEQMREQVQNIE